MSSTSNYTFIKGQKKYLNLLTAGYPSSRNIANIKTSYTFIDGQKKYFCKDNLKFNNYAANKIKSSIIHADSFNFEGSKVLKVVYIENNNIKTKLFGILPETYTYKDSLAKICGNRLAVLIQNYDTQKQHLYFINNILTDTGMVEINLNNIPTHNLVGTSSFNFNISNDGMYLEELAPQSIKSSGVMGTVYNYKTFILFASFDNLNNFITIDELSNFDDTYRAITPIPDGMLFFDYNINQKIYLTHKGKVNYITDDIYRNTNNKPILYLSLQGNYLYGGSSGDVYAKNLITNEITISSREISGGGPNVFTYLLKNELWKYIGTSNDYYIKLNKSGNVSQIQKNYDRYFGQFFHNNYNARVWYKLDHNNNTITFISPNLEDISYPVSNLPTGISITDYSVSNAPGVVLTTANAWYASLDMVNFTQI